MPLNQADKNFIAEGVGEAISQYVRRALAVRDSKIAALAARVAEVESKGIRYCGTHQRAMEYRRGDAVTAHGSLWVALKDNPADAPKACPDWQLAVKAGDPGRAGRDGREFPR